MLLLTVIWIEVSISVFNTYRKIYLLLGFWSLEVLAKVRHDLRQYLNLFFFSLVFYAYLRSKRYMRLTYFLIAFVCLYSLAGPSSPRCTFIILKPCNQIQFFTLDSIYICDELVSFRFSLLSTFCTISKFERINNKSFYRILLIFSVDTSLNPGPVYNSRPSCSNEWNVFKAKEIYLIHLNINSLLPKIDEIRYIAARANAAVIGIFQSKLDETILQPEIQISNYELLRYERNRNGGGVACYIRSDIGCAQKCFFPREI